MVVAMTEGEEEEEDEEDVVEEGGRSVGGRKASVQFIGGIKQIELTGRCEIEQKVKGVSILRTPHLHIVVKILKIDCADIGSFFYSTYGVLFFLKYYGSLGSISHEKAMI